MSEFNFDGLGIEEQFRKNGYRYGKAIEKQLKRLKKTNKYGN
jgi:hypothetical protein